MYVGPWQEYKLMKVIEDLRERHETSALSPHLLANNNNDSNSSSSSTYGDDNASSMSVPVRRAMPQLRAVRGVGMVYMDERSVSRGSCHSSGSGQATEEAATTPRSARVAAASTRMMTVPQRHGRSSSDGACSTAVHATTVVPPSSLASSLQLTQQRQQPLSSSSGVMPLAHYHPLISELARRVPLDTRAVGARAGQRVYERCCGAAAGATREQQASLRALLALHGKGSDEQSETVAWSVADAALQARVERRLRLHALYAGATPSAHEPPAPAVTAPALHSEDKDDERAAMTTATTATTHAHTVADVGEAGDDVDALLHWADELDCDAIDAMM